MAGASAALSEVGMNSSALWIVTALYGVQAAICFRSREFPQVAMLGGYVIANLGLIWSMS
jgi:hypothetical protein